MLESILVDEEMARKFVERAFPTLRNDEVLIALLCARRKYDQTLSTSQEILTRKVIRDNDVERALQKLRELSVVGLYLDKGRPISPTAYAVYVDLNPKSVIKAFGLFVQEVNRLLYDGITAQSLDYQTLKRIDVKLFSAIHRSDAREHPFWCLDIDRKDPAVLKGLMAAVGENNVVWASETHNGYHLIVKRSEDVGILLFRDGLPPAIAPFVEIKKEAMTPVPGTLQGGVLVKPVEVL